MDDDTQTDESSADASSDAEEPKTDAQVVGYTADDADGGGDWWMFEFSDGTALGWPQGEEPRAWLNGVPFRGSRSYTATEEPAFIDEVRQLAGRPVPGCDAPEPSGPLPVDVPNRGA